MNRRRTMTLTTKACVEDARQLDVRLLSRHGVLQEGEVFGYTWRSRGKAVASVDLRAGEGRVVVAYGQFGRGGLWQESVCTVALDHTPCHLGGQRVWWRCPAPGCGRRVAVLYGDLILACGRCHHLAHRCQSETAGDRAARQANKIRRRLGWAVGVLNAPGGKPKGMHWNTYERLRAMHEAHSQSALAGIARSLGLVHSQLARM